VTSRVCPKCGTTHDEASPCPDLCIGSGEDPFGVRDGSKIGTRIDRYELVERIGDGGMGVVYKAWDTDHSQDVALKLLHAELTCVPQVVERFFREARATLELDSEHIVRATDFGRTNNNDCYLVMELLDGPSLRSVIKEEKQLAVPRALHIAIQTADALRAAHEQGVVHRDLKPGNIQLVQHDGDVDYVKVLDFGIAKIAEGGGPALTRTGMILGSPAYMSPEQAAGKRIDHRADIYALGIVLYEMLVGSSPFAGLSPPQTLLSQINVKPEPPRVHRPDLPASIERVVLDCLAKRPDDRPGSMSELCETLHGLEAGDGNGAGPEAPWSSPRAAPAPAPDAALDPALRARVARTLGARRSWLRWWWIGLCAALVVIGSLAAFLSLGRFGCGGGAGLADAGPVKDARGAAVDGPAPRLDVTVNPPDAGPREDAEPSSLEEILDETLASLSQIPAATSKKERPQVVILSTPEGAEVFDGIKSLGKTPLTLASDEPRQLLVKRRGYQPVRLTISKHTTGILTADLVEEEEEEQEKEPPRAAAPSQKARRPHARTKRRRKRRRRRRRYRIHSISKLYRLYRRRRIKRRTYRRIRRALIKQRNRRLKIIGRLYRRRRITRSQYKRYVRAIRRYYR
jgi:serine/threonine-protein kinase